MLWLGVSYLPRPRPTEPTNATCRHDDDDDDDDDDTMTTTTHRQ
jgi:hypothetical protein